MGTGDETLGDNLRWTSIPSRGSSNTPRWLHATETGVSSGSVGHLLAGVRLYILCTIKRFAEFVFVSIDVFWGYR